MLVQLSVYAAFGPQTPRFTRRGYIMIHRLGFGVAQFDSRRQQRQKKGNVLRAPNEELYQKSIFVLSIYLEKNNPPPPQPARKG